MAIIVNTNVQSLMVQKSLNSATNLMNTSMERMSTGLKINSAADDAAGMAVSSKLESQVRGASVAQSNAQMGASLLTTTEGTLNVIQTNLQRIRDLSEQAANETYDTDSRTAIKTEIDQRLSEITRLSSTSEFNGIKLLDGSKADALKLQVGTGSTANDVIELDAAIFAKATASSMGTANLSDTTAFTDANFDSDTIRTYMAEVDDALANITDRKTLIGAAQNRLSSATEGLKVQETNLTAANSQIKDADIAVESSNFVKSQILQQASASLLVQANQAPSIAVSLI